MIKKISEFIKESNVNEARLEFSRNDDDFANAQQVIHDPNIFVYANPKLLAMCNKLCAVINKMTGCSMYVDGQFGKIDGEKVVMMFDVKSDKCVCVMPSHDKTMYASLYYFKDIDHNDGIADFYMTSETIGIVNLIKTFCKVIANDKNIEAVGSLNEALDVNQRKIIFTDKSKQYVDDILKIKPGEIGCGRNKSWHGDWTIELIDLIKSGVDPFDIAFDVRTKKANSEYWKYFGGGESQTMRPDTIDTLLWQLAAMAGLHSTANKPVEVNASLFTDEDEWFQRVAKMTTADAKQIMDDYEDAMETIQYTIDDLVEFYKAKGDEKLKVLDGVRQLLIVPGKGGLGKTTMVKNMLEKAGLRKNVDYVLTGSMSSDAESIYNTCYDFNGKIIILDDIPELFTGSYRRSLWKNLISGDMGEYGEPSVPARSTTTRYYDTRKYGNNMRKRYYAEAGKGSTMGAAKSRELEAALKSPDPNVRKKAEREAEELSMVSTNVNKPMTFTFTGAIIMLSNVSPADMKREIGSAQSWKAIQTRSRIVELNPPGWVIWLKEKSIILAQTEDTSIPDNNTIIPRDKVDEYIKYVERVISDGHHDDFNWRISKFVGKLMRKNRKWKDIVLSGSSSEETDF